MIHIVKLRFAVLLSLLAFSVISHAQESPSNFSDRGVSSVAALKLIGFTETQDFVELQPLVNGQTIDLAGFHVDQLNILAEPTESSRIGSLHFFLAGPVNINRWENNADFTIEAETDNLRLSRNDLPVGSYTLTVTPYEKPDLAGQKGAVKTISFSVVDSKTPGLSVPSIVAANLVAVDEATGSLHPISRITEGGTMDITGRAYGQGNITAVSEESSSTGSVLFELDGPIAIARSDNSPPYTLADEASHLQLQRDLPEGEYTLIVTPYAEADAQGDAGIPLMRNFKVGKTEEVGASSDVASVATSASSVKNVPGFTRLLPSPDSRIIYVSSSSGNDGNSCLSDSTPCKSIKASLRKMREGFPDHLYLKRGDVWRDESLINVPSGRNADEPAVVAYYGTGDRPKLENAQAAFFTHTLGLQHLKVVGLEFYSSHPADQVRNASATTDIIVTGDVHDILFEDNVFSHTNFMVNPQTTGKPTEIRLRRNIWLDTTTTIAAGTSKKNTKLRAGFYMEGAGDVLLEENVFAQTTKQGSGIAGRYLVFVKKLKNPRVLSARRNLFSDGVIFGLFETSINASTATWKSNAMVHMAEQPYGSLSHLADALTQRPLGIWNSEDFPGEGAEPR